MIKGPEYESEVSQTDTFECFSTAASRYHQQPGKQISVSDPKMSEADKLDHKALKGHDPASSGRREVFVSADDTFSVRLL